MRLFLNSVPLSDQMYHGHICTGRYSFIRVETIVSAVLSGVRYVSGHPVRWSIMVKMCLFPDVDVLHSVMRLMAILSNGLIGGFHHLKRVILNLGLLSATNHAVCIIFPDILVHNLPVILSFYQTVCMGITLMS